MRNTKQTSPRNIRKKLFKASNRANLKGNHRKMALTIKRNKEHNRFLIIEQEKRKIFRVLRKNNTNLKFYTQQNIFQKWRWTKHFFRQLKLKESSQAELNYKKCWWKSFRQKENNTKWKYCFIYRAKDNSISKYIGNYYKIFANI